MTRIRFEDLPSTNTPRNAENLNKLNNVAISSTEPTTGEEVWIEKGKNLFDKSSVLIGYGFSGTNGEVVVDATYYISDYIPIKENTSYYISGEKTSGMATIFYDKNKEYISGINILTGAFETPQNACFVRVNGKISELNNSIQIVEGTQATEYEDFIRKIYIKNDNGVYEEFYSEESVFEIKTGTGSPIPEYISSAENNHYEKVGKVVSYSFTMAVTGSWDITTKFITGLPRPKANVRFLAIDTTNSDKILRCSLNTNGEISNAYSASAPTEGHIIEGYITYITTD